MVSRLVSAMTGAALRAGNRVTIMRNSATLDELAEAAAAAKTTIDCSSYIYSPGKAAERFSEVFIERAQAGVEVTWSSTATDRPSSTRPIWIGCVTAA